MPRHTYRNTTLARAALKLSQNCPEATAIHFDDGSSISYGEAWTSGAALASALLARGTHPGDTLSFQLPNGRYAVIVMLAAAIGGFVINPIVPIYRGKEVRYILRHAETRVLFIPAELRGFNYVAMMEQLIDDCPDLRQVIYLGESQHLSEKFEAFDLVLESGKEQFPEPAQADPDDTKILLYTSGTTGNPKQVRHSHNTLNAALDNGVDGWQLTDQDLMLMPSPVTHITGYVNGMEMPFFTGVKTLLMSQWDVNEAIKLIENYGVTACVSATPFLKELVDTCQEKGKTLPGFRLFACGGASVPSALIHSAWDTLDACRAVRVYGSTEVPLVTVGFLDAEQRSLAAETDGRVANYDVIIVDDHGNDQGLDTDGEILAKGPAMMLGYSDNEQNRDAFTPSGYFRTGDIGRLLASGALVISDRKKDIIIRGGENIAARELEDTLLLSNAIAEVAIVAVPHSRLGEGVGACVVPAAGSQVDMNTLREILAESGLAKQKWPQYLELFSALPKTASGKVQKDKLRQSIRQQGVSL
ncbi:MAG: AMP-binding protein [Luminiphilus sp.]|nr:AMP-binding protein [Luminiphilus sp.]